MKAASIDRLRTLVRARAVTAACHRALVRTSDRNQLLEEVCRILVSQGGYAMAWVGLARHDPGRTIERVASAGGDAEYFRIFRSSWGDNEFGRGPSAIAVRTRTPQTVSEIASDPRAERWRELAASRGFASAASLPLVHGEEAIGVLGILARDTHAFEPEQVELLLELASDVAYGYQSLVMRDLQRSAEHRVRKLDRARRVMAQCNRALARAADEQQLFEESCRILAGPGGYYLAWIGLVEHDEAKTIRPVACANEHRFDFAGARISWGDNRYGRGPAGRAVRTGTLQIAEDPEHDAHFAVWRSQPGYKAVIRSALVLPLKLDDATVAVLGLSSIEPRAFDEDELALLEQLASDLAHGISALRARAAQRLAEQRVLESERRFHATFELAPIGIHHISPAGIILLVNPCFQRMLGYTAEELVGRHIREFMRADDWSFEAHLLEQRARLYEGAIERVKAEIPFGHKDGRQVWTEVTITLIRDTEGRPLYDLSAVVDISERRQAEAQLRGSEERYRSLTRLASEWYWELDEHYRLTVLKHHARDSSAVAESARRNLGKRPWDLPYTNMSEADWDALRRKLDARETFHDLALKRTNRAGVPAWLSMSGYPVFDGAGRCTGYRGITRNITERMRAEQMQHLEHAVASELARAEDEEAGVVSVIRVICELDGWECGRYFEIDERRGVLVYNGCWGSAAAPIQEFLAGTRNVEFPPGTGLAGRAWVSGEAHWSSDIPRDERVLRSNYAEQAGIRSTLAFPVSSEGQRIGVLALSSRRAMEPDERILRAVGAIGSQLGQFRHRKIAERALRHSNERFNVAVRATSDVIWDWDVAAGTIWRNENFAKVLGYASSETTNALRFWRERIHPEDRERTVASIRRVLHSRESAWSDEYRFRRADGSYAFVFDRGHVIRSDSGTPLRMIGAMTDVTERRTAEERVKTQAQLQRLIADFGRQALANINLDDVLQQAVTLLVATLRVEYCGVLELDCAGERLTYRAASGLPQDWVGHRAIEVRPGSRTAHALARKEALIVEDYSAEPELPPPAPREFGMRSAIQVPIHGPSDPFGLLGVYTRTLRRFNEDDVSFLASVANILAVAIERKNAEDRMSRLAQYDSLTGLPNRHLFQDRLVHAMAHAKRNEQLMAVLFIDLDRFKLVNDTRGHAVGDRLLVEAALRLNTCVRASDTVGRLGGDEFSAILAELSNPADASLVAQKIVDSLAKPFHLDGNEIYVSASIGITVYPHDGESAGTLIMNADAAMYRAKEQGRDNFQYFTREMNERAMARVQLESELRRALDRREFVLLYQPRVSLRERSICGFEALLRWNHPERGLVLPGDFIPVLEDTGLIVPVGEWVIAQACRQLVEWQRSGVPVAPVAVNLSARQFQQKDLEAVVRRFIGEAGLDASLIQFEITESLVMNDPEAAARILHGLHDAGVRLSVDDFGTGYSSLSYLKRFPIDALKIHQAFVRDIAIDADDAAIAVAIIRLAHSLSLQVVAEGVETEQQLEFLIAHGCDEMQGYYFAPSVTPRECERMLREGRRLRRAGAAPRRPRASRV